MWFNKLIVTKKVSLKKYWHVMYAASDIYIICLLKW